MLDRSSTPRARLARGAALACSLTLAGLVVTNAQLGCDAPAHDDTPDSKSPSAKAPAEPARPAEPAAPDVEPDHGPTPAAAVEVAKPEPEPKPEPKPEPVFMPASKSGGDFGAMRFPGEARELPQQQNPAPQAPTQQAPQR
jgi:hypothetical protein